MYLFRLRLMLPLVLVCSLLAYAAACGAPVKGSRRSSAPQADAALVRMRAALSSSSTAVRSAVVSGTRKEGFNDITGLPVDDPRPFELRVLGRDHALLLVQGPSGRVTRFGFIGDTAIFGQQPSMESTDVTTSSPSPDFVRRRRVEVSQLMLCVFGITSGPVPLTVVAATGSDVRFHTAAGDEWVLSLDRVSGRPVSLRYWDEVSVPDRTTPPAGASIGAVRLRVVRRAEVVMNVSAWRLWNGRWIPTIVVRAVAGGSRLEALAIDKVVVNAPLTESSFGR